MARGRGGGPPNTEYPDALAHIYSDCVLLRAATAVGPAVACAGLGSSLPIALRRASNPADLQRDVRPILAGTHRVSTASSSMTGEWVIPNRAAGVITSTLRFRSLAPPTPSELLDPAVSRGQAGPASRGDVRASLSGRGLTVQRRSRQHYYGAFTQLV